MSVTRFGYTITIEVGFASNPNLYLGSTTWTDITQYVRAASLHRGRSSELDTFRAGTASFVLRNEDRRFDPSYSAGPYFGNLLPMKRIRVKVTYNAVTYARWSGFIQDWPQTYDIGGHYSEVTVQAADAFTVLSRLKLPESVWQLTVQTDTPSAWWRLGETSGTTAVDSSGNGKHGVYVGGATFNSRSGLVAGSSDPAIGFDGVDDYIVYPRIVTSFPFSVEAWASWTSGGTGEANIFIQRTSDGVSRLTVGGGTDGSVSTAITNGPDSTGSAQLLSVRYDIHGVW